MVPINPALDASSPATLSLGWPKIPTVTDKRILSLEEAAVNLMSRPIAASSCESRAPGSIEGRERRTGATRTVPCDRALCEALARIVVGTVKAGVLGLAFFVGLAVAE
jgi:hypothetical protein